MPTSNPSDEIITIVDSNNRVVGSAPRHKMRENGLMHRVTYILVFNRSGELLVQTRSPIKDWYSGYLDFAAGGVLLVDENYTQSAKRELMEELGVAEKLTFEFDLYFEENSADHFTRSWGRVFSCVCDGPFKLQDAEVVDTRFMCVKEALRIDGNKVTPDTRLALISYLL